MAMLGQSPANMAQLFAQKGWGDATQIQQALETGDPKGLTFVQKLAPKIMQERPDLVAQAKRMLGMS